VIKRNKTTGLTSFKKNNNSKMKTTVFIVPVFIKFEDQLTEHCH